MQASVEILAARRVAKARRHELLPSWGSSGACAPLRAANALAYGERVARALELACGGHADRGFVARSHVRDENGSQTRSERLIPAARCKRLDQDAGVLSQSARPQLAKEFLHWLRTQCRHTNHKNRRLCGIQR
ncbi:MAG TPA: substrate-binding domain-containing protein [Polyangiales bacterium]|jgi:hypothetical protein|nr:substrate-binding domain-containing protein [Polyangiales bacterium]